MVAQANLTGRLESTVGAVTNPKLATSGQAKATRIGQAQPISALTLISLI